MSEREYVIEAEYHELARKKESLEVQLSTAKSHLAVKDLAIVAKEKECEALQAKIEFKDKQIEVCDQVDEERHRHAEARAIESEALVKNVADLQEENERLRQYEEQCNSLSQRFCKSLIAEGAPAAIAKLEELESELAEFKKFTKLYKLPPSTSANNLTKDNPEDSLVTFDALAAAEDFE